jgi:mono/diheme cytochrome c family protein
MLLLAFITAIGAFGADESPSAKSISTGPFSKVPGQAALRPNPLANDPDAVRAGKKLFVQHCAECHGNNAEGGKKAPSLHIRQVQDAAPGAIFWVMTNGVVRQGMPVWSKLPEPQRWQITAFIKSLSAASRTSGRIQAANQVQH